MPTQVAAYCSELREQTFLDHLFKACRAAQTQWKKLRRRTAPSSNHCGHYSIATCVFWFGKALPHPLPVSSPIPYCHFLLGGGGSGSGEQGAYARKGLRFKHSVYSASQCTVRRFTLVAAGQ